MSDGSNATTTDLSGEGRSSTERRDFLDRLEASYKRPFPETTEDSLAGGLSNTIAGRISNHFDLHGGGYMVPKRTSMRRHRS